MSNISQTIPECSAYYNVNQELHNLNPPAPLLGFEGVLVRQTVVSETKVIKGLPQTISPIPPSFYHSIPPSAPISSPSPQLDNSSNEISHMPARASPPFTRTISRELTELQQKYSSNIILLFLRGRSSDHVDTSSTVLQWKNANYARLPHNPENTATPQQSSNQQRYMDSVKKWDIIKAELGMLSKFVSEKQLDMSQAGNQIHASVRKFNSKVVDFSFNLLNHSKISSDLKSVFPIIANAALEMEDRFPFGIPILRKNQPKTLFLTQGQIRCIIANAFMCTFPKRLDVNGQELPEINFFKLFDGGARGDSKPKIEKILCILNYFKKVAQLQGEGKLLSFERRQLPQGMRPDWKNSKQRMSMVHVDCNKRIEAARDKLQIDFANRFVGGGVIGHGMVMEEIRFSICPELIAARLFTEALESDEVLIITGCEQFSTYSGYADSFTFKGPCNDPQDYEDPFGRRRTQIAVMDACYFRASEAQRQFEKDFVRRELNKCFCAFRPRRQQHVTPIATGNWGCGVFNGDPQLKFIIQWMAASQAGQRELHYHTAGDKEQSESIMRIVKFLGRKGVRVGTISEALKCYYLSEVKSPSYFKTQKPLFQFFEKHFK